MQSHNVPKLNVGQSALVNIKERMTGKITHLDLGKKMASNDRLGCTLVSPCQG